MERAVVAQAHRALDALAAADVDGFAGCDRDGLDRMLAELGRVRDVVAGFEVTIARRSRALAAEGKSECAEAVLAEHGRRAGRDAKAAAERERACREVPDLEDALAAGDVSTGHVDALAATTHGLDDETKAAFVEYGPQLASRAPSMTVAAFGHECRDLARLLAADSGEARLAQQRKQRSLKRWKDKVTGMWHLHATLDPVTGARLDTAIDAATRATRAAAPPDQRLSWDQASVDAFVGLLTGARSVDARVPDVAVHIDWRTLIDGLHDHSLCETSDGTHLPVSTVRRLCCAAEIFPVVLDGDGAVLDLGRARRLANREQRRALRAMYRTCGYPDCTVTVDGCEIHHVVPWERLGPTDLANLLPLCAFHHHMVHEGGWTLTLDPDRTVTLTRPDGAVVFKDTTTDRTASTQPATAPGPAAGTGSARSSGRSPPGGTGGDP